MPSAHLSLKEEDVVKLALEFLNNRELHITQLSLERETGVINGVYSDDMLFLRQLILDGQWDDVLEFVQPLESLEGFDAKRFRYIVCKHKYLELLCIKSEVAAATQQSVDVAVDEVVACLNELEKCAPSHEEYSSLCLLLTVPRFADHTEYQNWNPSSARVECFRAIHPLVEKYLPPERRPTAASEKSKNGSSGHQLSTAKNDRLVQLVIKGLLYEYCVEYCQLKATAPSGGASSAESGASSVLKLGGVLDGTGFTDADLSLPSWLQSIPPEIFACPFEQKTLNVDVERLKKPSLEASWTEHMLVTPIKPKTFPHSAMPNTRPRSAAADVMSRSLNPQLDGLPFGLQASSQRHLMALSVGDLHSTMSKSFASFHLTGKKSMNTSVDRLFEEASSDIFTSSSYGDLPAATILNKAGQAKCAANSESSAGATLPPMPPPRRPRSRSPEKRPKSDPPPIPQNATAVPSSRVASQARKEDQAPDEKAPNKGVSNGGNVTVAKVSVRSTPELYKEFQRQKLKSQEILCEQDKQRNDEYLKRQSLDSQYHQVGQVADNRLKEAMLDNSVKETILQDCNFPDSLTNKSLSGDDLKCTSTPKQHATTKTVTFPQVSPGIMHGHKSEVPASQVSQTTHAPVRGTAQIGQPLVASNAPRVVNGGMGKPSTLPNCQLNPADLAGLGISPLTWSPQEFQQRQDVQQKAKHGFTGSKAQLNNVTNGNVNNGSDAESKPRFVAVTSLEDVQAIRAAEFHPNGKLYAIGSNSKTLRVCAYPKVADLRESHQAYQPTVLFKRTKHHKGSIYCLAWNATGDLLATGSNDKTVKLMRFNSETCNVDGEDIELTMHDGTVRDMCFVEDMSNKSSLLISGGAGDCKIYVTDCVTATPFQALSGHSGHILSLYTWGGAMFVSGSQDRTIRFWDLRTRGCVNVIPSPAPGTGAVKGSAVAAVSVDPSGRMLVSGQEDSSCMLYDIRGNRNIQTFKPHTADIRTIRFSPRAYYLLTGSYDCKVVLTDLQGDLTLPLPSVVVAQHQDKVIQCRWHPSEFCFLSTSADKTATLWGLPGN